jgi:hypothetical protein
MATFYIQGPRQSRNEQNYKSIVLQEVTQIHENVTGATGNCR